MAQKLLKSKHGKALLRHLSDVENPNLEAVFGYLEEDPLAGRLKSDESGETAFHVTLRGNFNIEIKRTIIRKLVETCPKGAEIKDKEELTPLHLHINQAHVDEDIIGQLLTAFPGAASLVRAGSIPLFACARRSGVSFEVFKQVLKAYPNGAQWKDEGNCLAIHWAVRHRTPDKDKIRSLIRRFHLGVGMKDKQGSLPIHYICDFSDDLEAVSLIADAFPEGVRTRDIKGRTCLHIAALSVGRDHTLAVACEEIESERERASTSVHDSDPAHHDSDEDDEDIGTVEAFTVHELLERSKGKSRKIVRYLIDAYPQALVEENNFRLSPVETLMEKTKTVDTKLKSVRVFGLYDDPPTARMLLLAHRRFVCQGALPALKREHMVALFQLNWQARRLALFASFVGQLVLPQRANKAIDSSSSKVGPRNLKSKGKKASPMSSDGGTGSKSVSGGAESSDGITTDCIPRCNLLARLRVMGFEDCVRHCIAWL